MINQHHLNRYNNFVKTIQSLGQRNLEYFETHHIVPKSMGGTDNPSNLVNLKFREHFLAHWMLYMAYPQNYKLANAFHFMCNVIDKVPERRREMRLQFGLTSRSFDALKKRMADLGNISSKGLVSCVDVETGNKVRISCVEFDLFPDRYKFHTSGMISCLNVSANQLEYIPSHKYQNNKDLYIATTTLAIPSSIYKIYDPLTRRITEMTHGDFKAVNATRNKYERLLRVLNHKISVVDEDGKKHLIPLDEYRNGSYTHINHGTVKVFDTEDQTHKSIKLEAYDLEPQRYLTSTKGKVLAWDTVEQKNLLIDKALFDGVRYVGQTKNLTTVFDKVEQQYVQITREQAKDKKRYQGPCAGKTNVIFRETGQRLQIPVDDFDPSTHIKLGDTRYYFKALFVPKNKIKNIHIYEWAHLDQLKYQIQDLDLFNKLQHTYLK